MARDLAGWADELLRRVEWAHFASEKPLTTSPHDETCEAEWESGAMAYTPCACAERRRLTNGVPDLTRTLAAVLRAVAEKHKCLGVPPYFDERNCPLPRAVLAAMAPLAPLFPEETS